MSLDQIEEAINDLSDRDTNWWPFLWLRPEKHTPLTLARVVWLSVLYGVPCSALMVPLLSALKPVAPAELFATAFAFPMIFLLCGSAIVAPMWNRRAERLRARR